MKKQKLMVWVNIIKPLGTASFNSICPKILMFSRVSGIHLINKSYVCIINETTFTSCLEMSKNTCLFMIFTPYTFLIVFHIIIPPVSEFVVSLTVILHTTYFRRQEADQTFITTCKSLIDFLNLINKRWKCVSFYNIFGNLAMVFVRLP